jgi:hypothetical protein
MFAPRQAPAPQAALHAVTLPTVVITGQRQKAVKVAADSVAVPAARLQ